MVDHPGDERAAPGGTAAPDFLSPMNRTRRDADDGLPSADDQRDGACDPERGGGQRDERRHRCRDHPAHAVRPRRRCRPRHDVRAVHRRDPGPSGPMGAWRRGREVRRRRARRPDRCRAADDARLGQDARPALHVLFPSRRPAGDELRGRRRASRQRRDLVGDEVADLFPGDGCRDPGTPGGERDGARDPGRRVVRSPSVRRRGV